MTKSLLKMLMRRSYVQTIQIGSSAGSSWWCIRHSVCSRLHYVHLKILFEHLVKIVQLYCLSLLVVNYAFYYALLTLLWSIPRVCAATLKILFFFHLLFVYYLFLFIFIHLLSVYYLFLFILPLTWIILVCRPWPISVPPWATNTVLERVE